MSKVLRHTMSLEGFGAGPNDGMSWLFSCAFASDSKFVGRLPRIPGESNRYPPPCLRMGLVMSWKGAACA
jgi:hypothetical protein